MRRKPLHFYVSGLDVQILEGFRFKWDGRQIESGPMLIGLGAPGSGGVIDYETGRVDVEFRVKILLPELSEVLADFGADPDITAPVDAVIRSEGAVFDDHSFRLAGKGQIGDHRLFDRNGTRFEILAPTRCRPDAVSLSGDDIHEALMAEDSVSWNFYPTERRVVLQLPEQLGGEQSIMCLAGSYTFTGTPHLSSAAHDERQLGAT